MVSPLGGRKEPQDFAPERQRCIRWVLDLDNSVARLAKSSILYPGRLGVVALVRSKYLRRILGGLFSDWAMYVETCRAAVKPQPCSSL